MRVGLHTGTIVGGVVGSLEANFDIFGNDVLIANKVESKSLNNGVAISQATFDLVK
jgi:class 3 adenylate cyclase